jgi:lipopolysaccharide/colanic/teichoic acid biosynthesis glycosyltransferase
MEFDPIDFHRRPYWRAKRVADLVAAACLIVVLAPIALAVALVVLYDVGFPLLFWQERPGAWGRPFKLYKFRTMAAAYNAKGERVPDDQRLSAIGWYLRRLRLDELPQLFNILLGNMSFVGPRPLLPIDQSQSYASRLLVRPGLTGWAQVNGGRGLSPSDKAALDIWYVRNASFSLDLRILFATIPVLLRGESASPDAVQHAWSQLKECSATKGK